MASVAAAAIVALEKTRRVTFIPVFIVYSPAFFAQAPFALRADISDARVSNFLNFSAGDDVRPFLDVGDQPPTQLVRCRGLRANAKFGIALHDAGLREDFPQRLVERLHDRE